MVANSIVLEDAKIYSTQAYLVEAHWDSYVHTKFITEPHSHKLTVGGSPACQFLFLNYCIHISGVLF